MEAPPVCTSLVVKLAMRCNIACNYCYWFKDEDVMRRPPVLLDEVASALVSRIEEHLSRADVAGLTVLFHGGEPLLYGVVPFAKLCAELRGAEQRSGGPLDLRLMTNGLLLDDDWFDTIIAHRVALGISLDGPEAIHDARRVDHRGRGTQRAVIASIEAARRRGIDVGVLAVCDPQSNPAEVLDAIVSVGVERLDILIPDATHMDRPQPISSYYMGLFDQWYRVYAPRGVEIRFFTDVVRGLLGAHSTSHVIGGGAITGATICTDGALEALDTLRVAGTGSVQSTLNLLRDDIAAIAGDPLWREIVAATSNLPTPCRGCPVSHVCGGGHVAHRWSPQTRYDNRSVYCEDIKLIIGYVWKEISRDLHVEYGDGQLADIVTP
ncbi:MAG TPA: radical SAM protein [Candidatus Tumulicola sp.]